MEGKQVDMETVRTADPDFLTKLLDALPQVVLLVDDDVRILYRNAAASALFGEGIILRRRAGDVLKCVTAARSDDGCGSGKACATCVMRTSVGKAVNGTGVYRHRMVFEISQGDTVREIPLLITAIPFAGNGSRLCLLLLEDISEILQLKGFLPICASCKRIRNDDNYWQAVEEYIKAHIIDLDFTHGICPDCIQKLYPEYSQAVLAAQKGPKPAPVAR